MTMIMNGELGRILKQQIVQQHLPAETGVNHDKPLAQGAPRTATISDLLCMPIWVLIITDLSTRALWQLPAKTTSSEAG
jgi:hypothetical protein